MNDTDGYKLRNDGNTDNDGSDNSSRYRSNDDMTTDRLQTTVVMTYRGTKAMIMMALFAVVLLLFVPCEYGNHIHS